MRTLVLNQNYTPLGTIDWTKAVTLLFSGKVDVVEEYENHDIRSASLTMKMPSVIRLNKYVNGKKVGVRFNKSNVYIRDKGKCQYCLRKINENRSTYDHVIPKSRGGKTDWNNIVTCCYGCNQRKDCRTPEEAGLKLITRPYRPESLPVEQAFSLRYKNKIPESWKPYVPNLQNDDD